MSVYEKLSETQKFACRVIADHARSTAFAIADGILPGNDGRNYVLRKIMRRAIYHGREHLGLKDAFFYKVCDLVVSEMNGAYPELETQRDFIGKMVQLEEKRFGNTLTSGLGKFSDIDKFIDEVRDDEWLFDDSKSLTITVDLPSSPRPMKSFIFSKGKLVHVKLVYPDGNEVLESPDLMPNQERLRLEQQHKEIKNLLDAQKSGTLPNYNDIQKILREKQQIDEHLKSVRAIRPLLDELHKQDLFRKMGTLYDTYGVPRDLMRLKLEERGFKFGESEFTENL